MFLVSKILIVLYYSHILNWMFIVLDHLYNPQVYEANTKFISFDQVVTTLKL